MSDETTELRTIVRALLATLETCEHYVEEGQGETCPEVATHRVDGPHDQTFRLCAKHAKEFRDGLAYPHRFPVAEMPIAKLVKRARKALAAGGAR
jgi:hypothetical protein